MARWPRRVVLVVSGLLVLGAAASGGAVSDQVRDEAAYFALGAADGNVGMVLRELGTRKEVGDSDALRVRRHVQWTGTPAASFDLGLVAVARTAKDITQAPQTADLSAADPGLLVGLRLDGGGHALRSLLGTVDQGSQGEWVLGGVAEDLPVRSNAQWRMQNPEWDGWGPRSWEVPSSEFSREASRHGDRVSSPEGGPKAARGGSPRRAEIPKGGNQGPGTGDGASRANPKSEISREATRHGDRNPKSPGGKSPGRGAGVVTPEPATLALLALGGLAVVIRRRR